MLDEELVNFTKVDSKTDHTGPAVYVIKNTVDNSFYVGSSGHLRNRVKSHMCCLRKDKHPNKGLQAAFNSWDNPLELYFTPTSSREAAYNGEQVLLDKFFGQAGFLNTAKDARTSSKGTKLSQETVAKLSAKGKGKPKPAGFSEKLSKANKEHPRREELNQALSENRKSEKNPNAKLVLCYGVMYATGSDAARALGISRSVMARRLGTGKGCDPFCQKLSD